MKLHVEQLEARNLPNAATLVGGVLSVTSPRGLLHNVMAYWVRGSSSESLPGPLH